MLEWLNAGLIAYLKQRMKDGRKERREEGRKETMNG